MAGDDGESRENLLRMLEEFLDAYPEATVADVMAEFDLTDGEIRQLFAELKVAIEDGWLLS